MSLSTHAEALPGSWNFRDIGGIQTPGGPVRSGIVFRSANLTQLDPTGLENLQKLGVTDVFDLRGPLEIGRDGADRIPESVTVTVAPFHPEEGEMPVHEVAEDGSPAKQEDRVKAYYAAMPVLQPAQDSVAALLRRVADGTGGVLVHCAAGKDRTGWAIATLLTVAGANRDAIAADYLLSNTATESLRAWMQAQYGDAFLADNSILGVELDYLDAAFESVERNFGSFDGYLDAIGIDETVRRRIRSRLVG